MSVTYSIIPYDQTFNKPETLQWLKEYDVEVPSATPLGRNPTPREVREVLDTLQDCKITYRIVGSIWQADIDYPDGNISINVPFSGNEDKEFNLSFTGDLHHITQITTQLSKLCGTFFILQNGEDPILIKN